MSLVFADPAFNRDHAFASLSNVCVYQLHSSLGFHNLESIAAPFSSAMTENRNKSPSGALLSRLCERKCRCSKAREQRSFCQPIQNDMLANTKTTQLAKAQTNAKSKGANAALRSARTDQNRGTRVKGAGAAFVFERRFQT